MRAEASHAHHYGVELRIVADALDENGYVVDLCELEPTLEDCADRYRDRLLDELPQFEGTNPSMENLARRFLENLTGKLNWGNWQAIEMRIRENEAAWAAFRETR